MSGHGLQHCIKEGLSRRRAAMLTTSPLRIQTDIPAIAFDVPAGTDLLTVPRPAPPLANPTSAIAQALLAPRGTLPLAQVVAAASPEKVPAHKTAVIVVSDITRPDVPYTGPASICTRCCTRSKPRAFCQNILPFLWLLA